MRKTSIIIPFLYLAFVVAAFIVMLITTADTPMSGIFLVMLTFPWSLLLSRVQDVFHINSAMFNGLFLLIGGFFNSFRTPYLVA